MEEPMDGPRLDVDSPRGRRERGLYAEIKPADHIFVLTVTEGIALERKPELQGSVQRDALRRKVEAVNRLASFATEGFTVIDTSQGREACLLEIKRLLWELL
jgi:hypothetical protein